MFFCVYHAPKTEEYSESETIIFPEDMDVDINEFNSFAGTGRINKYLTMEQNFDDFLLNNYNRKNS